VCKGRVKDGKAGICERQDGHGILHRCGRCGKEYIGTEPMEEYQCVLEKAAAEHDKGMADIAVECIYKEMDKKREPRPQRKKRCRPSKK
jgi:hypothetical protein